MAEWFGMGGYGVFVWLAYIVSILVILAMLLATRRKLRSAIERDYAERK